jgi:hypothetical protein
MKYTLRSNEDGVTKTIDASDMAAALKRAAAWMRNGEWGTDGATVGVTVEFRGPPRFSLAEDGDIEIHCDCGWGYVTTDTDGIACAYWQPSGGELKNVATDTTPLSAMAALIAAIPSDAEAEEIIAEEYLDVAIEPDHGGKIAAATRGEQTCGNSPDDHDWTADGEGGCRENPGVWSRGGTIMTFSTHCRKCGLHRLERTVGTQRNPGDHDTVEYEMLSGEAIAAHRKNGDMDEEKENVERGQ